MPGPAHVFDAPGSREKSAQLAMGMGELGAQLSRLCKGDGLVQVRFPIAGRVGSAGEQGPAKQSQGDGFQIEILLPACRIECAWCACSAASRCAASQEGMAELGPSAMRAVPSDPRDALSGRWRASWVAPGGASAIRGRERHFPIALQISPTMIIKIAPPMPPPAKSPMIEPMSLRVYFAGLSLLTIVAMIFQLPSFWRR
jgi:hypothetical protein